MNMYACVRMCVCVCIIGVQSVYVYVCMHMYISVCGYVHDGCACAVYLYTQV